MSARPTAHRSPIAIVSLVVLLAVAGWFASSVVRFGNATEDAPPGAESTSESTTSTSETERVVSTGHGDRQAIGLGETPSTASDSPASDAPRPGKPVVAVVRGRVLDARGAGIAGAMVAVANQTESEVGIAFGIPRDLIDSRLDSVRSTADGAFTLSLAKLGPFELIASHDEHPNARQSGRADGPSVDGVIIVMRDGGTITGTVVGVPGDAGAVTVVARRVEKGLAAAAKTVSSSFIDFSGLVEQFGASIGSRQAPVAADHGFRLSGLDPDASFQVFAIRGTDADRLPSRCTERVSVRTGAVGVELRWRESLRVDLRVVDDASGAPIETLDISVGPVREIEVLGTAMPVPMRMPVAQKHFPGGLVTLDDLDAGEAKNPRLAIEVSAHGHRSWSRGDIAVTGQRHIELGLVRLVRAPIVRVHVTAGSEPVVGAGVSLETVIADEASTAQAGPLVTDDDEEPTSTDADGRCELTADFDGEARVVVQSETHARYVSAPLTLPAYGVIDHEVVLLVGGRAKVRVVDGHGAPVPHVEIHRRGEDDDTATVKADELGEARFEWLTPGEHAFSLPDSEDSPLGRIRIRVGDSPVRRNHDEVMVTIVDDTDVEVLLTQPLRGTLRGVVTLDGDPLDRATVRVVDVAFAQDPDDVSAAIADRVGSLLGGLGAKDRTRASTDLDGQFEFEEVRTGTRRLIVTHDELAMPATVDVVIVEGANRHDVALRATTLRGRVLGPDGAPLNGVTITASTDTATEGSDRADANLDDATAMLGELFGGAGGANSVRSDAEGRFELRGVQSGVPLRVRATAKTFIADSVRVDAVPIGAMRDGIELHLVAAGRVHVRCTVAGAMVVKAEWAGGEPVPKGASASRTTLLKSGRALIDGLPPGRWKLTLDGAPDATASGIERLVDVTAGVLVRVEF